MVCNTITAAKCFEAVDYHIKSQQNTLKFVVVLCQKKSNQLIAALQM